MRALGFAFVLLALGACGEETIVLATLPADGDAGAAPRGRRPRCLRTADCPAGDYCSKSRCDAPAGECSHKPLFCQQEDRFEPLCGCTSGITYLDDCHRKQAGEESATKGECEESARTCDATSRPCPTGTTCQLLGSGPADSPACGSELGTCWGIVTCPPSARGEWSECGAAPGAMKCVDTCTAIQSGRRFTRELCPKGP